MAVLQPKSVQRCLFCTILPMPAYASAILAAGWFFWLTPFLLIKRNPAPGAKLDRRARWGVLLEALAYSMLWWGNFWTRPPQGWRIEELHTEEGRLDEVFRSITMPDTAAAVK